MEMTEAEVNAKLHTQMKYLHYKIYCLIDRIPSGKQKPLRFSKGILIERTGYKNGKGWKNKKEKRKRVQKPEAANRPVLESESGVVLFKMLVQVFVAQPKEVLPLQLRVCNHPPSSNYRQLQCHHMARAGIKSLPSLFHLLIFSLTFQRAASNTKLETQGAQDQEYRTMRRKQDMRFRNIKQIVGRSHNRGFNVKL